MAEPIFTVIDDGAPIVVAPRDGAERVRRAQEGGRPVALDEAERVAYLGVSAGERGPAAGLARGAGLHPARPRRAPALAE
jgi:hypothetical protein